MMGAMDVQPTTEETRHPAGSDPTSLRVSAARALLSPALNYADLLQPPVAPTRGFAGALKGLLRRLRTTALLPILSRQTAFNRAVVERLDAIDSHLQTAHQARQQVDRQTAQALEALCLKVHTLQDSVERRILERHDSVDRRILEIQGRVEQAELLWLRAPTTLQETNEALSARLDELRMDLLRLWSQWDTVSAQLHAEAGSHLSDLRFQVAELGRRWRKLFWEAGHHALPPSLAQAATEYYQEFDYFGFEERLRGDETSVRDKQRIYLRHFRESVASGGAPILDVGCGRGEFLELIRGDGLCARGVDASLDNILRCREKGLEVAHADALEYLTSLPDESLGGIFACQFIEHLPVDYLVAFTRTCFQKIQSGGKVIFETINPECIVAMKNFYADLSHHKPIPAATARFLLESSGFHYVETLYLSPYPAEDALRLCAGTAPVVSQINRAFDRLNRLLFGHQDYAVVATR